MGMSSTFAFRADEFDKAFAVISAEREFSSVFQENGIIAAEHRMEFAYAVDIHDGRTVYADEFFRVEF